MFKIQEYLVQKNLYTQTSLKSHSLFTQNTCDVPNLKNLTTHSWSLLCFCIGSDVLCLTLNSLGIQTCGQNDSTNWRIQDCSSSKMQTEACPFSWYEKPRISEMHVPFRTLCIWINWEFPLCDLLKKKLLHERFYHHLCTSVVNQWIKNPRMCPPFSLRSPSKNGKRLLNE